MIPTQRELLAALNEANGRIVYLCQVANDYAIKLGLGKKFNADDWTNTLEIAMAKGKLNETH